MSGTNRQIKTALRAVEQQIPHLEAAILVEGRRPDLAGGLSELWARRRILRQYLRTRRDEAQKDVVDFLKWRDGDGARQLIEARTRARPAPTETRGLATICDSHHSSPAEFGQ